MATKLSRMVTYIQEASNHKATKWFDHVVLECYVRKKNYYVSTTKVPMANKICWTIA